MTAIPKFFSLSLSEPLPEKRLTPRLGLLREATGVPLFVFYSPRASSPSYHPLMGLDAWENLVSTTPFSQELLLLAPFFKSGGGKAYCLILPGGNPLSLTEMIGEDRGHDEKTGIYLLKSHYDHTDMICFPQLSRKTDPTLTLNFFKVILSQLSPWPHFHLFVDLPLLATEAAVRWAREIHSPQVSLTAPFLFGSDHFFPPSPLVAAFLQQSDALHGPVQNPTILRSPSPYFPLQEYSSPEANYLLENQINFLKRDREGHIKLWGAYTRAARTDLEQRFISGRRALVYLQEAIEELCEPFLMEPLIPHLVPLIEVSLASSLQKALQPLNLEDKFRVQVKITPQKGEDILQINSFVRMPLHADEVQLSLQLRS